MFNDPTYSLKQDIAMFAGALLTISIIVFSYFA